MRIDRRIRLWLATRSAGKCDATNADMTRMCERQAVACVRIFGRKRNVCALHITPLDEGGHALAFLALFYGIPLSLDRHWNPYRKT